jgi:hypothetical protein
MKKTYIVLLVSIMLAFPLTSCNQDSAGSEQAEQALEDFFSLLNSGQYDNADAYYGGDYEALISFNPLLDAEDHAVLWQNACNLNGLQCLTVRSVTLKDHHDNNYIFFVEFNNPDGSLFVRGPCCGATEAEMPSETHFEYRVVRNMDGAFKVMDPPVYVP